MDKSIQQNLEKCWISVSDELPKPNKEVLVLAKDGQMEVMFYRPPDGKHTFGWFPGGLPLENSSYWMELPPPPKISK